MAEEVQRSGEEGPGMISYVSVIDYQKWLLKKKKLAFAIDQSIKFGI